MQQCMVPTQKFSELNITVTSRRGISATVLMICFQPAGQITHCDGSWRQLPRWNWTPPNCTSLWLHFLPLMHPSLSNVHWYLFALANSFPLLAVTTEARSKEVTTTEYLIVEMATVDLTGVAAPLYAVAVVILAQGQKSSCVSRAWLLLLKLINVINLRLVFLQLQMLRLLLGAALAEHLYSLAFCPNLCLPHKIFYLAWR